MKSEMNTVKTTIVKKMEGMEFRETFLLKKNRGPIQVKW